MIYLLDNLSENLFCLTQIDMTFLLFLLDRNIHFFDKYVDFLRVNFSINTFFKS